jgi:hypothetical protein
MSTIKDTNYWKLQKAVPFSQLNTSENGLRDEEVNVIEDLFTSEIF